MSEAAPTQVLRSMGSGCRLSSIPVFGRELLAGRWRRFSLQSRFLLFGDDSFRDLYPLMGGTAIGTGLIILPWRRRLVFEPDCVRTMGPFNLAQRRYQIARLGDLVLDGTILRRRSDGTKILKLNRIECGPREPQTPRASIPSA